MKKIRWLDKETKREGVIVTKREGVILGVIGKPGNATLVVYCDDGLIREVLAKNIRP